MNKGLYENNKDNSMTILKLRIIIHFANHSHCKCRGNVSNDGVLMVMAFDRLKPGFFERICILKIVIFLKEMQE